MNEIINLILGMICLALAMMDYFLLGINLTTPLLTFAFGTNIIFYVMIKLDKSKGGKK